MIPEQIFFRPDALALRWTRIDRGQSPNSMMTGSWDDVARQQKAAIHASRWRPFRIVHRLQESSSISSFYLEPADGEVLIRHDACKYLPIRVRAHEGAEASSS